MFIFKPALVLFCPVGIISSCHYQKAISAYDREDFKVALNHAKDGMIISIVFKFLKTQYTNAYIYIDK